MIQVYICPHCDAVRIFSRKKEAFCPECGQKMALSDLTFLQWSEMTLEERKEYARKWNQKK